MIRLITCIRKKEGMSPDQFRKHWSDSQFLDCFDRLVSMLKPVRHSRNLTLQVPANERLMKFRGSAEPYDAIVEWWWHSAADLAGSLETAEAQAALLELQAYQGLFIDFESSPSFFTEA